MRMMNAHSLARRTLIAAASLALLPAFAQSPALADTLAKLSASKTITLGVRKNAAPFSYIDAAGKPAGFSWALCQAIVQQLSAELKTPIAVKFEPVTLGESFDLLKQGRIDLHCGSTPVRPNSRADANLASCLRCAAKKASTLALGPVKPFASYDEGAKLLKGGAIDTLVADELLIPRDAEIAVRRDQLTVEPYALVMRKGDAAFVDAVDRALAKVVSGPQARQLAEAAGLKVDHMTLDAWRNPNKQPAPPVF